jgi:hypothetical protein
MPPLRLVAPDVVVSNVPTRVPGDLPHRLSVCHAAYDDATCGPVV